MPNLLQGMSFPGYDPEAIAAAEAQVRSLCGWHIAPQLTETVSVRTDRDGSVFLLSLYVTAVASATVDGLSVGFEHHPPDRELLLDGYWPLSRRQMVQVTLTHGYPECPADVSQAVALLASGGLVPERRVQSDRMGPFSASYFNDSPSLSATRLLNAYRLPAVA